VASDVIVVVIVVVVVVKPGIRLEGASVIDAVH
jgi:hypothetical protein